MPLPWMNAWFDVCGDAPATLELSEEEEWDPVGNAVHFRAATEDLKHRLDSVGCLHALLHSAVHVQAA